MKLMEVTVSPDPDDPRMPGSVILVKEGYVISFDIHIVIVDLKIND